MLGKDGVIEPRTFLQLAERSARWSSLLRERGVRPGDRVLVLVGTNLDWLEIVLACLKVGAVVVPAPVTMSATTLEARMAATAARLVVAARAAEPEIVRMGERPHVLYVDEAQPLLLGAPEHAPTHDSTSRDLAFVLTSAGASGGPHLVAHTNASAFAARVAAEYWLDAGRGDAVWCTASAGSPSTVWHSLLGPWSRGAETLLHEGEFEPLERLDLIYRLGTTILAQTPAEYAALAQHPELGRFRPSQLRRLVSTGDYLDPEVSAVFEETWGLVIHDGYSQAETNVIVGNGAEAGFKPGSLGLPLTRTPGRDRRRQRERAPARSGRRARHARPHADALRRLLGGPGRDEGGLPRRLVRDRRHSDGRRGRIPVVPRTRGGHAHESRRSASAPLRANGRFASTTRLPRARSSACGISSVEGSS